MAQEISAIDLGVLSSALQLLDHKIAMLHNLRLDYMLDLTD